MARRASRAVRSGLNASPTGSPLRSSASSASGPVAFSSDGDDSSDGVSSESGIVRIPVDQNRSRGGPTALVVNTSGRVSGNASVYSRNRRRKMLWSLLQILWRSVHRARSPSFHACFTRFAIGALRPARTVRTEIGGRRRKGEGERGGEGEWGWEEREKGRGGGSAGLSDRARSEPSDLDPFVKNHCAERSISTALIETPDSSSYATVRTTRRSSLHPPMRRKMRSRYRMESS